MKKLIGMMKINLFVLYFLVLLGTIVLSGCKVTIDTGEPSQDGQKEVKELGIDSSDEPQNDEGEEEKEYDISKLKIGESIEGLELTDKSDEDINNRPARSFTFAGEKEVVGELYGYHDEMYEQDHIAFASDVQKTLKIPFANTVDTITLFDSTILNADSIDEKIQKKLLAGEKIKVKLIITMYRYVGFQESEKFVDMKVENIEIIEQNSEKKENLVLSAAGFEPSWTISIDGNTLTYSSPELFSDENATGRLDFHLNVLEKNGDDIVFEGQYISGKFIKKDCVTEGVGDTLPYTVEYTYEGTTNTNGCGEQILENTEEEIIAETTDSFFTVGNVGKIEDLEQKLGIKIFDDIDPSEGIVFRINDVFKNYTMIGITDKTGVGYNVLYKKIGDTYEKIWEGQDIDEESCKNINTNYSEIIHWSVFEDCRYALEK